MNKLTKLNQRFNLDTQFPFAFPSNTLGYSEQQVTFSNINIRLDEEIKDASYYGDVIKRLDACNEGDSVVITVNSPGGNVTGMVALLSAMQACQAEVVVFIEGEAHSAASIIALNAPQVAVGSFANMMCHNASSYLAGKQHEIQSNWEFNKKYLEGIMKDTYKYFLTESELQQMLDGKDFWFDAEEISTRLERKIQMLEKEQQKQLKELRKKVQEQEEQQVEPVVKPSKKPKVKPSEQTEENTLTNN